MFQKVPKNAEKEKGKKRKCDKKNKSIELKKKQKKIKKYEEDLLTDSDFTIHDTDNSDEADFESYCNTLLFQHNSDNEENVNTTFGLNDIQFFEESLFKLNKHDWVLVKFMTKKSVKYYVGQVIEMCHEIPMIKYLRKTQTKQKGQLFVYPNVDDICELKHVEDIVSVLPQPTISRRGQISFEVNFGMLNIQ